MEEGAHRGAEDWLESFRKLPEEETLNSDLKDEKDS